MNVEIVLIFPSRVTCLYKPYLVLIAVFVLRDIVLSKATKLQSRKEKPAPSLALSTREARPRAALPTPLGTYLHYSLENRKKETIKQQQHTYNALLQPSSPTNP